jgi:hypothetical protein
MVSILPAPTDNAAGDRRTAVSRPGRDPGRLQQYWLFFERASMRWAG